MIRFRAIHTCINGGLRLESVTPMALFLTNHMLPQVSYTHSHTQTLALFHAQYTLTQGNLHYRLATLGYRNRNTYGVETYIF